MNLALVLGEKNGNNVKPKLLNIRDNLNISCFNDVPDFVDKSIKLGSVYDRVVILPKYIKDGSALKDLYSFWSNARQTEIVLIAKEDTDAELAKQFLNTFNAPCITTMLVSATTVHLIAEAVLLPVSQITEKYGIKDFMNIEIEEAFETPEVEISEQEEQSQHVEQLSNKEEKKSKKEKRSLLGSLFGGGKKAKEQKPVQQQPIQVEEPQKQINPELQVEQHQTQLPQQETINQEEFNEEPQMQAMSQEDDYEDYKEEDYEYDESVSEQENYDESYGTNDVVEHEVEEDEEEEDFEPIQETKPTQDIEEVEEDFGDLELDNTYDDFSVEPKHRTQLEEVDENLGDIDITESERQYREETEAPKVIEKTVVKEVIRDKKGNRVSDTILSGVLDGRYKKVIIVTGDRRSGVTTTALNIAQTFAQSVNVLYFDCDIDNHGLLSYIDYNAFRNYERIHMDGVKRCKSSGAFRNCVISFADNLDLLTTDYTCSANDEDIRDAATVVAENSNDYNVIVVDCPSDKLYLIDELILIGVPILCVEGNKCGFMNMLCRLEDSSLPLRYKRSFVSKGTMFVTKTEKGTDLKSLLRYIRDMFEPDGVDWFSMRVLKFSGKLSNKILNFILEG